MLHTRRHKTLSKINCFLAFFIQSVILDNHLCQLVDVASHEDLFESVSFSIKVLQSLLDQFELAQFVLKLILVLLSDLAR